MMNARPPIFSPTETSRYPSRRMSGAPRIAQKMTLVGRRTNAIADKVNDQVKLLNEILLARPILLLVERNVVRKGQ
jgi:hypothetical protein